jgi:acyl-CoA dehydrogenase
MGKDGVVSREVWTKAGAAGLLCPAIPTEYGGGSNEIMRELIVRAL